MIHHNVGNIPPSWTYSEETLFSKFHLSSTAVHTLWVFHADWRFVSNKLYQKSYSKNALSFPCMVKGTSVWYKVRLTQFILVTTLDYLPVFLPSVTNFKLCNRSTQSKIYPWHPMQTNLSSCNHLCNPYPDVGTDLHNGLLWQPPCTSLCHCLSWRGSHSFLYVLAHFQAHHCRKLLQLSEKWALE